MNTLKKIDSVVLERIKTEYSLETFNLKYPLPQRPLRMLGLVKIDGQIFQSNVFARLLLLSTSIAFSRQVKSIFIAPRVEFNLPVFSSEIIIMGAKRAVLIDIHRRGCPFIESDQWFHEKLNSIKKERENLFTEPVELKGSIKNIFSPSMCFFKIPKDRDMEATELIAEFLEVFLEIVKKADTLTGQEIERLIYENEEYKKTIIENDPAVKIYKFFFGKKSGVERAKELFFD